jgi:hypothetical protein
MTFHKTIKVKVSDGIPELDENDLSSGVNFRLVISGTKDEINSIKIPTNYRAKIVFEIQNGDSNRAEINAYDSHDKMMKKYVDFEYKNKSLEKDLDKEKLLKVGAAILSKAGVLIK